ncbi:hypothetical protein KBD59_02205 [Candidatus Gracilibacteria bacterium]|nr:hypothetical protein [Candidatus Gracilibacteria bacterium]
MAIRSPDGPDRQTADQEKVVLKDPTLDSSPRTGSLRLDTRGAAHGAERLFEEAAATKGLNRLLVRWGITGKSPLTTRALPEDLTLVRVMVDAENADYFYRAAQEMDLGVPITRLIPARGGLTPIDLIAPPGKIEELLELAGEGSRAFAVDQYDDGTQRNSIPIMVVNGGHLLPLAPPFPPNREIGKHRFGYVMKDGTVVRDQDAPASNPMSFSSAVEIPTTDDTLSADAVVWQRNVEGTLAPEKTGRRSTLTVDTSKLYGDGTEVRPGVRTLGQQLKSLARLGSRNFFISGTIDTVEITSLNEKAEGLLGKVGLTLKAAEISCWLSETTLNHENGVTKASGLPSDFVMDKLRKSENARFPTSRRLADAMGGNTTADRGGSFGTLVSEDSGDFGTNVKEITGIDERVRIATDGPEFLDPSGALDRLRRLLTDGATRLIVMHAPGGTGKSRLITELTKGEPDTAMTLSFEGEAGDPGSGLARIARSLSEHLSTTHVNKPATQKLQELVDDPQCAGRFISPDMQARQMDIATLGLALEHPAITVNDDTQNLHRVDLDSLLSALGPRIRVGKATIILSRELPAPVIALIKRMNDATPGSATAIAYPGLDFVSYEASHGTATAYIGSYLKKLHAADPERYKGEKELMVEGAMLGPLPMHLAKIAENNPQIMNDLVRSLFEGNALERDADNIIRMKEGVDIAKVIASADSPAEYPRIFATALKSLPPDEQKLLYTAALTGKQLTPVQLQKIAAKVLVAGKSHQGTIDKLLDRFFTGIENRETKVVDSFSWTHDLQREATLANIPEAEAAQLASVAFQEAEVRTVGLLQWIARFVKPDIHSAFWISYNQTLRENLADARKRNSVPEALFCARSTMQIDVVQETLGQMNALSTHAAAQRSRGNINKERDAVNGLGDIAKTARNETISLLKPFNGDEPVTEPKKITEQAEACLHGVKERLASLQRIKNSADAVIAAYSNRAAEQLAPLVKLSKELDQLNAINETLSIIMKELGTLSREPRYTLKNIIPALNTLSSQVTALGSIDISSAITSTDSALEKLAPQQLPPDHLVATVREALFTLAELSSTGGDVKEGLEAVSTLKKLYPLPEDFNLDITSLPPDQLRLRLAEVFTHYIGLMMGQGSVKVFDQSNQELLSGPTRTELDTKYPMEGAVVRARALFRKMDMAQRGILPITERESAWSELQDMSKNEELNRRIFGALNSSNKAQAGNALEVMRIIRIRAPFQYLRYQVQNVPSADTAHHPDPYIQEDERLFSPQRLGDVENLSGEVEKLLESIAVFDEHEKRHAGALITMSRLSVDEVKAQALMWAGEPDESLRVCQEGSRISTINGLHGQAFRFGMVETLLGRVFSTIQKNEDEDTWAEREPKNYDGATLIASLKTLIEQKLPQARGLNNPAMVEETHLDILKYMSLVFEHNLASQEWGELQKNHEKAKQHITQINYSNGHIEEALRTISDLELKIEQDDDEEESPDTPSADATRKIVGAYKPTLEGINIQQGIIETHRERIAALEAELSALLKQTMPILDKYRTNNKEVTDYLEVGFESIRALVGSGDSAICSTKMNIADPGLKQHYYIYQAFSQMCNLALQYGIPLPDDLITHPAFSGSEGAVRVILLHGRTLQNSPFTHKMQNDLHSLSGLLSRVEQRSGEFGEREIDIENTAIKQTRARWETMNSKG